MPLCLKKLEVSYTFDESKNIDVKNLGQNLEPVQNIERTTWQFKVVLFMLIHVTGTKNILCLSNLMNPTHGKVGR
jgi:hypothetical protein